MIRAALLLSLFAAAAPAAAAEACRTMGSATAADVPLDPSQPAGLLASIPVVVKLHGLTSASLAAYPVNCDRGKIAAGPHTYTLTGENDDANAPRRAMPDDRTGPVAVLAEVFEMGPALAAAPQPGGEPRGVKNRYALATAYRDVMVVWKAYDAIPDDARLRADIGLALSGGLAPVMRFDMKGGRAQILAK